MRQSVRSFVAAGVLPDEHSGADEIRVREEQLAAITPPLTEKEARAMLTCFGPDDCYGLAWTMVHLIESCGTDIVDEMPSEHVLPWLYMLWNRQQVGRGLGD